MRILRRRGFDGEVAELLAEMMDYYSTNHLTKVLAQYYNQSLLRAPSLDAALQLAMDMGYPAYRGRLPTIRPTVRFERPTQLTPLEVLHSSGGGMIVWAGKTPKTFDTTPANLSIPLEMRLCATAPTTRPIPQGVMEHYVIDDLIPISEDIAIYQEDSNGQRTYWRITRHAWLFWGERVTDNPQMVKYPVLAMTTQGYGLYLRFKNPTPPGLYISYLPLDFANIPNYNNLIRSFQHPNIAIYPSNQSIMVTPFRMPDTREVLFHKACESSRFNGFIRSNSDIGSLVREYFPDDVIDARVRETPNGLVVYIIPFQAGWVSTSINQLTSTINQHISDALPLQGPGPATPITYQEMNAESWQINASIVGQDPLAVTQYMSDYLAEFLYRFLDEIDVRFWITKLARSELVDAITSFTVINLNTNTTIYSMGSTANPVVPMYNNTPPRFLSSIAINISAT